MLVYLSIIVVIISVFQKPLMLWFSVWVWKRVNQTEHHPCASEINYLLSWSLEHRFSLLTFPDIPDICLIWLTWHFSTVAAILSSTFGVLILRGLSVLQFVVVVVIYIYYFITFFHCGIWRGKTVSDSVACNKNPQPGNIEIMLHIRLPGDTTSRRVNVEPKCQDLSDWSTQPLTCRKTVVKQ